jgi:hypothetical protein
MTRGPLVTKLLCVALVATVMVPLGREVYPHLEDMIGSLPFDAAEAVLSASMGFALYAAMFG